jgi:hypothetical protein
MLQEVISTEIVFARNCDIISVLLVAENQTDRL